ncbi:MAG: hypothetical protein ACXIUD_05550 [Mongoliitalea sp.]
MRAIFRFLSTLSKHPAQILIVTTWELLPAAVLGKILYKYKLVYDVQENYAKNVHWNLPNRSSLKKYVQQLLIQSIESFSRPWIDHYSLAEECYLEELPRFKPATVLPNTFSGEEITKSHIHIPKNKPIRFLITGTLTAVYGTIDGINWFKAFLKHHSNAQLIISGHCPLKYFEQELIDSIYGMESIELTISQEPIPYTSLLKHYEEADMILLPYHLIPSIVPKIPSKIYECLALKKPMLLPKNPVWEALIQPYQAGICLDFMDHTGIPQLIGGIFQTDFYSKAHIPEALWAHSEARFLELIASFESPKIN